MFNRVKSLLYNLYNTIPQSEREGRKAMYNKDTMEERTQESALRSELLKRKEKDQKIRKEITGGLESGELDRDSQQYKELTRELEKTDKENTTWMKKIIHQHGWPDQTLVGEDGEEAAWLLVQHADHDNDFQKHCIPLLTQSVEEGEASPSHLAYLIDRVRVHREGKCQLYGTQFSKHEDGEIKPFPICEEENLNKRRKEMGMGPYKKYEINGET